MRIPRNLGPKITRVAKQLLASGLNTENVVLRWRETVLPDGYVADLESTHAGAVVSEKSETVPAFVHYVNIQTTGFVKHAEVGMGDVILDFLGAVDLDGKPGLRYEVGGKLYVAKVASSSLQSSWDVRINGTPITKTVLVTLIS